MAEAERATLGSLPDSLTEWILQLAVTGVRSEAVANKITWHLNRESRHFKDWALETGCLNLPIPV